MVLMPLLTWFLTHVVGMEHQGQDFLLREIEEVSNMYGYGFVIFFCCIFGPVLEEFSFRFWGIGKRYAMIVSTVLMALLCWGEMSSALFGIAVLVSLLAVIFLVHDRNRQTLIFLIVSSILFALMHISGFSEWSLFAVIGLLEILGTALLCSYLTINHSFLFAILLHCANNLLASWPPSGKLSLETDDYAITATPITETEYWNITGTNEHYGDNTMVAGTLVECAHKLMAQQYKAEGIDLDTASFMPRQKEQSIQLYLIGIHCKDTGKVPDYKAILHALEEEEWITLDTTFEAVYIIDLADSALLDSNSRSHHYVPYTMQGIVTELRKVYHIPAVLAEGVDEKLTLYIHEDTWLVDFTEEYLEKLREDGLSITPSTTQKMKVITVSD